LTLVLAGRSILAISADVTGKSLAIRVRGLLGMRSAAAPLSHRHIQLGERSMSMVRARGLRGLLVAAFAASAGIAATPAAQADPTAAQSELTAVTGQGLGRVIVSPDAALGKGNFEARVKVNVHGTTPNTDFAVTRSVDLTADGICTGTDFATVAQIQTSSGGAGAVEFERSGSPQSQFDLLIRVVGADGTVLQSECMTITAK
jgi:hypothetical protein